MINGRLWWRQCPEAQVEAAKTERAAIRGWGPTLRLLILRMGATICSIPILILIGQRFY